jgi:hypothetical protein
MARLPSVASQLAGMQASSGLSWWHMVWHNQPDWPQSQVSWQRWL